MKAELLAIGSELLGPLRAETNSLWLTERLLDAGIEVVARATLADDLALLESAFREALSRADVVIATGGLGPTADDLTREAAAGATGRPLRREASIVEALRARFARYGRTMSATNEKQADVIEGAEALPNARGTAPGQALELGGRLLVLLPGPPGEMKPMFDEQVLPRLRARAGATRVVQPARPAHRRHARERGGRDRRARLLPVREPEDHDPGSGRPGGAPPRGARRRRPRRRAADRGARACSCATRSAGRVFSEDGRDLPHVVMGLLRERGLSLSLAESCTGGLLSARVTDVPGASATLERAFVTYANRAKVEELGVDPALLERHGAVSEEVAAAMAQGARRAASADVGVGITGIAGPDGGTAEKPVGLVFVALDGAAGTRVRRSLFPGARERVRFQATQVALEMLRRGLLGLPPL